MMEENREDRDVHDFLTVSELDTFNDKVNMILNKDSGNGKKESETKPEVQPKPVNQESFVVNPTELDEDLLYQLADIIDGKTHFNEQDIKEEEPEGPTTHDGILNSIAVAYITEDNLPLAVALLKDPTVENHKFIIPNDYYELKSGKSLEERIQQEFFAFKPDKYTQEVGMKLKKILEDNSPNLFMVVTSTDELTNKYLTQAGYKMTASFNTEWEKSSVNLWIN
jgi:hypothetical protein